MATKLTDQAPQPPAPNLTAASYVELVLESRTLKRAVDEANGKFRNHRKRMEQLGVDLKAHALLEELAKLDPDEQAGRLRRTRQYAAFMSLPIGSQPELFAEPPPSGPDAAAAARLRASDAEAAGYQAGKKGQDRTPPDYGDDALEAAWLEGWDDGQRVLAAGMVPGATRKRRAGRGRGTLNGKAPTDGNTAAGW